VVSIVGGLYAVAVAILLAYALLVLLMTDTGRGVGFITFGAIVLLDIRPVVCFCSVCGVVFVVRVVLDCAAHICVLLYHQAGLLTSPMLLALTLTGIRAAFVSWGPLYACRCRLVLMCFSPDRTDGAVATGSWATAPWC
jgi:hypothetical protein